MENEQGKEPENKVEIQQPEAPNPEEKKPEEKKRDMVEFAYYDFINFAMQQNSTPLIERLRVNNDTDEDLKNLKLKLHFDPAFAGDLTLNIDYIEAHKSIKFEPVDVVVSADFLFSNTERVNGNMTCTLTQDEDTELFRKNMSVKIYAVNEWPGAGRMPQILAAFVTPNHPLIAQVLSGAADVLKKWGEDVALEGYQGDKNRVRLQAAAIYESICSVGIVYNNPPASFEEGQKIRLPHTVLSDKQGTCLDMTVLYASCLEAVGINPLIFIIMGHAFCGFYLSEESQRVYSDCWSDDVYAFKNMLLSGAEEFLPVECTAMNKDKSLSFEKAVELGKAHFNNPGKFYYGLDVFRCRQRGIRPIATRREDIRDVTDNLEAGDSNALKPKNMDFSLENRSVEDNGPLTKQQLWERKLLDFSLRNSLLNFHSGRTYINLPAADTAAIEDRLDQGIKLTLIPKGEDLGEIDEQTSVTGQFGETNLTRYVKTRFETNEIMTDLTEEELARRAKNLQRSSKNSLEENGANTLYMALGFLHWYEGDYSKQEHFAPLVLVPIDIVKKLGYQIKTRDEEAQINITVLEFLRQDYGIDIKGLDPLPLDEHGIGIPLVYKTIRDAIVSKTRWSVEDSASIGLFSFAQFVMWNDLRSRASELEENKIVKSLIEGRVTWDDESESVGADELDRKVKPSDLAVPMSADSSQLAAIKASADGKSFVLHGPPGTGKSQTITNMIASALMQGKSVLFVAEKMAALSVVEKRLDKIGIGPFCLELHSNKSSKSAVLDQLSEVLEVGHLKSPEEYKSEADKLLSLRNELSGVVDAIHEKRECGASLYDLICRFEKNKEYSGRVNVGRDEKFDYRKISSSDGALWSDLIHEFTGAAAVVGDYKNHPLKGLHKTDYSMQIRDGFDASLEEAAVKTLSLKTHADKLQTELGTSLPLTRDNIRDLPGIADALSGKTVIKGILKSDDFAGSMNSSLEFVEKLRKYKSSRGKLSSEYSEEAFSGTSLNPSSELLKLKAADSKNFLSKGMTYSAAVKTLKLYSKNPSDITKDNVADKLEALKTLGVKKQELKDIPSSLKTALDAFWLDDKTDPDALEDSLRDTAVVHGVIAKLDPSKASGVINSLPVTIDSTNKDELTKLTDEVESFVKDNEIEIDDIKDGENYPDRLNSRITAFIGNSGKLRDWTYYQGIRNKLKDAGLGAVISAFEDGKCESQNLQEAFDAALSYRMISDIIENDKTLANFRAASYETTIEKYLNTLSEFRELTIKELAARLSANIPSSGGKSADSSEVGKLKKAIKSGGRNMSIRKLFGETGSLIRRICPCMLMSPISVAQYIDLSFPKFDLVIFDEASQLPTSEAIGTIARGENLIVVGDPKQLPPTSFFKAEKAVEEYTDQDDLESLLDDCLAISMPQSFLKWHYRSRHESLIAYSNAMYYDSGLFTFPSPSDLESKVSLVPVPDGVYEFGKSRTNKAEAKAVVDEIIRRLKDERLRCDSIGVVTFSVVQQHLIEDMLEEAFTKEPDLDSFNRSAAEPIFIKNLENVQGDERDVILFSVCYGPDEQGKVSMNFGPLNREGGWRRLNVAITRSRKEMIIYSTLRPEQIDTARVTSKGVAGLKGFLEFAKYGSSMLSVREGGSVRRDEVAEQIASKVRQMGYDVKTNVGSSGYRVDIGVVDKDNPEKYILGILIDGRNFVDASTCDDRFSVQPGVLKGLGWNILRVWILEWLDDPQKTLDSIEAELTGLSQITEEEFDPKMTTNGAAAIQTVSDNGSAKIKGRVFEQVLEEDTGRRIYEESVDAPGGTQEVFLSATPQARIDIRKTAVNFILKEAPISRKLLVKKTINKWGITRATARMEQIFNSAMADAHFSITNDDGAEFFWKDGQDPEKYELFRVPAEGVQSSRSFDDIPSSEIRNAMINILKDQGAMNREDLIKQTARLFGFARTGSVIERVCGFAIDKYVDAGILTNDDGRIVYNG